MGDLRNKLAKELRSLQHKAWMLQHYPPKPPAPIPACWCGKTCYETDIISAQDRNGRTWIYCPAHTPVFCDCCDLATRQVGNRHLCEWCWERSKR